MRSVGTLHGRQAASRQGHHAGCGHTSLSFDDLVDTLRRAGLRMTENRRAILRALLAARSPLNLEEIRAHSAHHGGRPDFATVFRTMEQLEVLRLVHRVNLGRTSSHFELLDPRSHHDHLVCVTCGRVVPLVDDCPVEKLERDLARRHGFTEIRHSLEFFGKCPECSK
jgi:Fur family transcriptional regulator, ferric uptake regulator